MTNTVFVCGRDVGLDQPTYIIAEAGINHNGDINIALELTRAAKNSGADAVKFQTFRGPDLMIESAAAAVYLEAGVGREDVYSFAHRVAMDDDDHRRIWREAKEAGITFLSSVFSNHSVDLLEDLGVEAYKIASMDLDNPALLSYVAATGKPIILSTGMGTLAEVERALNTIVRAGNEDVILLHCTSQYPTPPGDVNLRAINTMADAFGFPVGFSDHTEGNVITLAAAARGACLIEKHFTLDKTMPGPDHAQSGEPDEFKALVAGIRDIETALGTGKKAPTEAEMGMREGMRRSIVSTGAIAAGTVLTAEMLDFKRPGTGISPAEAEWVIGRVAKADIPGDAIIERAHLN